MYQAYEYASNAVSLVKFLLEIVLRNPKTLKNPKNEWNQHFIGRVLYNTQKQDASQKL